jgi:SEC-C motif-containing protein
MTDSICPCRATDAAAKPYAECCKPYIEEARPAPSPEALMRSRYSAYVLGKIDYLLDSLAPEVRYDFDRAMVTNWSKQAKWLGLAILDTEEGRPGDSRGFVEFAADFIMDGERMQHRERSLFRFDEADQRWYFVEEAKRKSEPIVKGAQPGRNDPCPCGSGKKYKKCCGAAAS